MFTPIFRYIRHKLDIGDFKASVGLDPFIVLTPPGSHKASLLTEHRSADAVSLDAWEEC